MKVVLKDKRRNPRIMSIDGKRFIFPSNKEIVKDISLFAFKELSKCNWIEVREYKDTVEGKVELGKGIDSIVEPPSVMEPEKVEVDSPKEEVEEIISNIKEELAPAVDSVKEEKSVEVVEEEKSTVNYSSLTKKELRILLEGKGVDTSGMSKANMVDWLNSNT